MPAGVARLRRVDDVTELGIVRVAPWTHSTGRLLCIHQLIHFSQDLIVVVVVVIVVWVSSYIGY